MDHYSPFGSKSLAEIRAEDLAKLCEVHEGWYVEYKRQSPAATAIAKSLAAFANTYGGWLFLGVAEKSKDEPTAGEICGLPRDEVDSCLQRLRKSAADHLNPTPHFETAVVWGPGASVGLPAEKAVVCVRIPQSASAPHVHSSGQIYRRVAGASEPRPETDRFVLDQLWKRQDEVKKRHDDWHKRDPEFSDSERTKPYIRLMMIADPWFERDPWLQDEDEVGSALGHGHGISAIPFDTVYTTAGGFIGRQLTGNDPQNLALTWRLRRNLQSDVVIPLPLYETDDVRMLELQLHGYTHVAEFTSILKKYTAGKLRIVDLNYLFNVLIGVAATHERLCAIAGWGENYYFRVKLLNMWRTVPFLDIQAALARFATSGLPMCLDAATSIPSSVGPTSYLEVDRHAQIESIDMRALGQALRMFAPIAIAFGVPPWLSTNDEEELAYVRSLQDAGTRGIDVQRRRNSRSIK